MSDMTLPARLLDAERRRILKVLRPFAKAKKARLTHSNWEWTAIVTPSHFEAAARLYRELGGRV